MTKQRAIKKLAYWLNDPGLNAEAILDFVCNTDQDEYGEQEGLGMLPPLSKKGKYQWEVESNTSEN